MNHLTHPRHGRIWAAVAVCSVLLSSCSVMVEAEDMQAKARASGLISLQLLSSCDEGVGTEASPIVVAALTAIAPRLVDLGFSFFSEKLKEKAESYSVSYAAQNTTRYAARQGDNDGEIEIQFPRCILIYGGDGGPWKAADDKSFYPEQVRNNTTKPEIFFAGELVVEAHNPYGLFYKIVPQKLSVHGSANKGAHDLVLEFQLEIPDGPIQGGVTIASIMPPILNVDAGMMYSFDGTYSTKWEPLPTPRKIADEVSVPVTLAAKVNRTKQGDGAFLFYELASVLDESRKEVVEAVKQETEKIRGN